MKSITTASFLATIAILIIVLYLQNCVAQKNTVEFERLQCIVFPNSGFSVNKCKVKLIRRDRLFVDFEGRLNRTITSVFAHGRVFYKYSSNEYRPLFIDHWEDFCGYMSGATNNVFFNRMYPSYRQYVNFNHSCPYHPGLIIVKMGNISLDAFTPFQFIPSGRYRIDVSVHEGFNGTCMFLGKAYGSVSDHRIEIF